MPPNSTGRATNPLSPQSLPPTLVTSSISPSQQREVSQARITAMDPSVSIPEKFQG